MDLELAGRTALVTGASKGIGLATVRALTAEGVKVAAVARTTNADLDATGAIVVTADLSTPDGVRDGIGGALEAIGDLDILVNNVGGGSPELMGGFRQLTDEAWTKGFDLNFFAAVRTIRLALPGLLRTKGKEFGPQGVRVNTVSPGATRTYLWEGPIGAAIAASQGIDQATMLAAMPAASGMTTGRLVEPGEIAELIAFLVSPKGASIAGADYIMDGGALKSV